MTRTGSGLPARTAANAIPRWAARPWVPPTRARVLAGLALFVLSAYVSFGVFREAPHARAALASGAHASSALPEVSGAPDAPARPAVDASTPDVAAPVGGEPLDVITGRIVKGGTVSSALRKQGVTPQLVHEIARALRPVFDFRRARAGDFFALIRDDDGALMSFEYHRGRREIFRLVPEGEALVPRAESAPLDRRMTNLGGVVERSLSGAIRGLGERADLVQAFADIFVWDIDFSTQSQPGDEFRMVFEKLYDREGFVEYGRILAAEYRTDERRFVGIYFEDDDGYGDYFTPGGHSVRRTFLRAPLSYTRISSRYSQSRLHPILKVRRPHKGIDYAAPHGTPVWAVADGVVKFAGRNGGFGRLVKIRHSNGYTSFYGHLARFAPNLRKGARVRQKDVIGYVGSSGLSTGPHLDYRLQLNGRFVDPLKVVFPKGDPIEVRSRTRFEQVRDAQLRELAEALPPLTLEAAM